MGTKPTLVASVDIQAPAEESKAADTPQAEISNTDICEGYDCCPDAKWVSTLSYCKYLEQSERAVDAGSFTWILTLQDTIISAVLRIGTKQCLFNPKTYETG